jgi:uncharacterized protein YbjT (DUF2867 family)
MTKIVVTGANGGLGSEVINQLLSLAPDKLHAVSTRRPEEAGWIGEQGVEVRHGDFDAPETLETAFEGADRVLLISTREDNERRIQQQRNAIDAARKAGVRHLYYTSIVQRAGSSFEPTAGHLQTETDLAESGLDFTIFRNGQYIENLPLFLGQSFQTRVLALPPDGPVAWVARADLAEGIARVILSGGFKGESLLLTGPEALTFSEIAAIASTIVGVSIHRWVIDHREYETNLIASGFSPRLAHVLASGFRSRASGELAAVDPTLGDLLGRARHSVKDVLPVLLAKSARAPMAAATNS